MLLISAWCCSLRREAYEAFILVQLLFCKGSQHPMFTLSVLTLQKNIWPCRGCYCESAVTSAVPAAAAAAAMAASRRVIWCSLCCCYYYYDGTSQGPKADNHTCRQSTASQLYMKLKAELPTVTWLSVFVLLVWCVVCMHLLVFFIRAVNQHCLVEAICQALCCSAAAVANS